MPAKPKPPLRTLRELRIDLAMTLPELADRAGLSKATLSMIERGRLLANQHELDALGAALGITLENRMQVVHEDGAA